MKGEPFYESDKIPTRGIIIQSEMVEETIDDTRFVIKPTGNHRAFIDGKPVPVEFARATMIAARKFSESI